MFCNYQSYHIVFCLVSTSFTRTVRWSLDFMTIFIKRVFVFLLIALFISFVLIPAYEVIIGGQLYDNVKQHIIDNLNFDSLEIWKRVFIFYLALWCGKAILWALATARIEK